MDFACLIKLSKAELMHFAEFVTPERKVRVDMGKGELIGVVEGELNHWKVSVSGQKEKKEKEDKKDGKDDNGDEKDDDEDKGSKQSDEEPNEFSEPDDYIEIVVVLPDARTITLKVEADYMIDTVKALIHQKASIPRRHQRLTYKGVLLEDFMSLLDYDIYANATLHLLISGTGGTAKRARNSFVAEELVVDEESEVMDVSVQIGDPPLVTHLLNMTTTDMDIIQRIKSMNRQMLKGFYQRIKDTKNADRIPDMIRPFIKEMQDIEVATSTLTKRVVVCRNFVRSLIIQRLTADGYAEGGKVTPRFKKWLDSYFTVHEEEHDLVSKAAKMNMG